MVITTLRELKGAQPVTEGTASLYRMGLMDMDDSEVIEALAQCVRKNTWRPAVAEIREAAAAKLMDGQPEPDDVYGDIMALMSKYGLYGRITEYGRAEGDPPYPSVLVQRVVLSLGGWKRCCLWENEEGSFHNAVVSTARTHRSRIAREAHDMLSIAPDQRQAARRAITAACVRQDNGFVTMGLSAIAARAAKEIAKMDISEAPQRTRQGFSRLDVTSLAATAAESKD